jgi:hypothetical protein
MTSEKAPDREPVGTTSLGVLEGTTAVVLALVPASLVWLSTAEYLPSWCRLPSVELEIYGVLLLLTASVLLVSVLALLQTWDTSSAAPVVGPTPGKEHPSVQSIKEIP